MSYYNTFLVFCVVEEKCPSLSTVFSLQYSIFLLLKKKKTFTASKQVFSCQTVPNQTVRNITPVVQITAVFVRLTFTHYVAQSKKI